MAISIRSGYQTGGTTTDGSGGFTVTKPSTIQNGDYVVVIVGQQDEGIVTSPGGGFTDLWGGSASGNDRGCGIFYKYITNAAGETNYAFDSSTASISIGWVSMAISGIDSVTPEDVAFLSPSALANDISPNTPAVTTATNGAMAFAVWAVNSDSATDQPGGNWTAIADDVGGNGVLNVAYQVFPTAGTTTGTPEITNVVSGQESMVAMWVFRPSSEVASYNINTGDSAAEPDVTVTEDLVIGTTPKFINVFDEVYASESVTAGTTPKEINVYDTVNVNDTDGLVVLEANLNIAGQSGAFVIQAEGSTNAGFGEWANARYRGQGFKTSGETITQIEFYYSQQTYGVKVYIDTADANSIPEHAIGGELYSWEITEAELAGGAVYTLPVPLATTAAQQYVVYLAPWNTSTHAYVDNYRDMVFRNANVYADGYAVVNTGGSWTVSDSGNLDMKFSLYTEAGPIDKIGVSEDVTVEKAAPAVPLNININGWYNSSWSYREKVTISASQVEADATDFPVFLRLSDLSATFHSNCNQTDARDIRVTKGDGITELAREVLFYDSTNDVGEIFFKYEGTLSSSTDTEVYIYYGNGSATDYAVDATYGRNNVWDDNYVAVYHMAEASGSVVDSTGNGHTGTFSGNVPNRQTGFQTGTYSHYFDGNQDVITVPRDSAFETNLLTATIWFKRDGAQVDWFKMIQYSYIDNSPYGTWGIDGWNDDSGIVARVGSDTTNYDLSPNFTSADATWYYASLTHNGTAQEFRVNGSQIATGSNTLTLGDYGEGLGIGRGYDSSLDYTFKGYLCEARVSNSARAATWVDTEYNNMSAPATFYSVSTAEAGGEALITVSEDVIVVRANLTIDVYDSVNISEDITSKVPIQFINVDDDISVSEDITAARNLHEINVYDEVFVSENISSAEDHFEINVYDSVTAEQNVLGATSNVPPIVVLNSPDDEGSTADTTPALTFTGTDANVDPVRYNLQLWQFDSTTDALSFDATSTECVRVTYNAALQPSDYISFATFIKRPDWTNQTAGVIISNTETGGYSCYLNQNGGVNHIRWYVYANGTYNVAEYDYSSAGWKPYSTHHIAGTYDGRYLRLYIDGVLQKTTDLGTTYSITYSYNVDVMIGSEPGGGTPSTPGTPYLDDTTLSDVRLYHGTLSVDNIADILDGTGYITNLIGWWKMDEGTGTDINDSSGNNLDGVAINTPSWTNEDLFHEYVGNLEADVVSGTDLGFSGDPDNEDPFASGQLVTYTVQSALGFATYKWKVRGIDPTGSNTYGNWAATRSFLLQETYYEINKYDEVYVSENISSSTDHFEINVYDNINVSEDITTWKSILTIDVYDTVTATRYLVVSRNPTIEVFRSIAVSENIIIGTTPKFIDVYDLVSVSEDITTWKSILTVEVYDSINVSEQDPPDITLTSPDLYEVYKYENISVSEDISSATDHFEINVYDEVFVSEGITTRVPTCFISVYDNVSIDDSLPTVEEQGGAPEYWEINTGDDIYVSENIISRASPLTINVAQWYNQSWGYRQKVTINASQVEADATDFPVYVRLGDLNASFHTNVNQTDARDIRVTKSDGITELPIEVVSYDSTNDVGELYFKYEGTLSSSTDTDVYIYYGNAGASSYAHTDTYGKHNVWNSTYQAVYHLSETTGSAEDSTSNANDGTFAGSVPNRSTGHQAGTYSQYFDGVHDRIYVAPDSGLQGPNVTVSAWFKRDGVQNYDYPKIVSYGDVDPSPYDSYSLNIWKTDYTIGAHFASDSTSYDIDPRGTCTDATWYYGVITHNGTSQEHRENATQIATESNTFTLGNFGSAGLGIGCSWAYEGDSPGFNDYTFKGYISEVRISNAARPSTWTDTEYNNMYAPATFYTTGSVEAVGGEPYIVVTEDITIEKVESYFEINTGDDIYVSESVSRNAGGMITVGTSGGVVGTSITVSTLSSTSKLIAFVGNHQGTVTGVTLNGTPLTKMIGAATAFNETAELWYIDNPGELSSVSLAATFSGGSGRTIGYLCLEGTKAGDNDVEATNVGSSSPATVDITPLANNAIVIASAYSEASFTQGTGETNVFILQGESYENAAGSYDIQTTAETQTMDFVLGSGQRWAICAVAIYPATGSFDLEVHDDIVVSIDRAVQFDLDFFEINVGDDITTQDVLQWPDLQIDVHDDITVTERRQVYHTATSMQNMQFRCIDIMGWTKDTLDDPVSQSEIDELVLKIRNNFNVTHIGISVPMNTNAEALADRGYAFGIEPATYAGMFASAIHNLGMGVIWRMTDCWFEAGGLYSMTYKGSELNSYWMSRASDYVSNNISMFGNGDIVAPYPEADAHQALDEGGSYNDFFVQLKEAIDLVAHNNSKYFFGGFSSQNYTGVVQGGRSGDMFNIPDVASVDHYGACLGPGYRFSSGDAARQTDTSGTDTYTVPVSITESASTRCDFIPEKIAYNETIDVYIVNKGTGDWTMTIHDSSNNLVQMCDHEDFSSKTNTGIATLTNAQITNGAWNTFTVQWDNPQTDVTYHFHLTSTVADGTVRVLSGHSGDLNYVAHEQYKCNATADAIEIDLRKIADKHSCRVFLQEWGDFWSTDASRSNPVRNQTDHTTYLDSIYTAMDRLALDGILIGFNYWRATGGEEGIMNNSSPYDLLYEGTELQGHYGEYTGPKSIVVHDDITATENIGLGGNAISLDGSTQYGTIANWAGLDGLTNYTFEGYFYNSPTSAAYANAGGIGNGTDNGFSRLTTENSTGNTGANFAVQWSGTDADGYITSGVFPQGTWSHVAEVYNHATQKTYIYVNGVEASYSLQQTADGTIQSSNGFNFYLGRGQSGVSAPKWKGAIGGFVRVWNVARSQSEINENKAQQLESAQESGLIINLKFTEGYGDSIANEYAAGNDMTLTGSPGWTVGPGGLIDKEYYWHDDIAVSESVTVLITELKINTYDSVGVSESITPLEANLIINVYDSVSVSESAVPAVVTLVDYYDISNRDEWVQLATSIKGSGQSFTGDGRTLVSAVVYMFKEGSPSGSVVAKIYAETGTYGTSSIPTGSALAQSEVINTSDITTAYPNFDPYTFTFSGANQIVLEDNVHYVLSIEYTLGDGSNYVGIGADETSPTHDGNSSYSDGIDWTAYPQWDVCFYIYGAGETAGWEIDVNDSIAVSEDIQKYVAGYTIEVYDNVTASEDITILQPSLKVDVYDSVAGSESFESSRGGQPTIEGAVENITVADVSIVSVPTITCIDYYPESNYNSGYALQGIFAYESCAQSFTGNGGNITSVKVYLRKYGSPTGTVTVSIYAHTGTYGTSSKPTGGALVSQTMAASSLTTSYALYEFTFATPYTTTYGTKYCVVVNWDGDDFSDYVSAGRDTTSPSHAGNAAGLSAATWSADPDRDLIFYVYALGGTLAAWNVDVGDNLTVAEDLTVSSTTRNVNVYDTINVSEDKTLDVNPKNLSVYDSVNVSESISLSRSTHNIEVYDSIAVSQYVSGTNLEEGEIFVIDDINVSEYTAFWTNRLNINVYETITVSESISAVQPILTMDIHDDVEVSDYTTYATERDGWQITEPEKGIWTNEEESTSIWTDESPVITTPWTEE